MKILSSLLQRFESPPNTTKQQELDARTHGSWVMSLSVLLILLAAAFFVRFSRCY